MTPPDRVHVKAHAKFNPMLRVLAKETSGYHGIETVFALLELSDELTVERSEGGVELDVSGADTGPTEENLAYRAAQAVIRGTGNTFGVRIRLDKAIPMQAGLGGGSSDAAATLHAVNQLAPRPLPKQELLQLATQLGSDVAFFVSAARLAVGWNRGERLFQLRPPPPAPCLIAIPPARVSTPEAYQLLDRVQDFETRRATIVLDAEAFETWGSIARLGGNDFENIVFGKEPVVRTLFEQVAMTTPLLVRMTGSGSAIVAVYRREEDLEDAVSNLGTRDKTLIKTRTMP